MGNFMAILLVVGVTFLLAGCLAESTELSPTSTPDDETLFRPVSYEFNDEFVAGGLDAPKTFPFQVPAGADEVAALLTWTIPGAVLEFQLENPNGTTIATGFAETDQRRYVATPDLPMAGNWTATVTATRGVDVHFTLNMTARQGVDHGPIRQEYTIGRGAFAEINLNMIPGDIFDYVWNADADLYFNIHFHGENGTERPVEFRGRAHEGNFTAPDRQVYSLLWRNEGLTPVRVEADVEGDYRLHSMSR